MLLISKRGRSVTYIPFFWLLCGLLLGVILLWNIKAWEDFSWRTHGFAAGFCLLFICSFFWSIKRVSRVNIGFSGWSLFSRKAISAQARLAVHTRVGTGRKSAGTLYHALRVEDEEVSFEILEVSSAIWISKVVPRISESLGIPECEGLEDMDRYIKTQRSGRIQIALLLLPALCLFSYAGWLAYKGWVSKKREAAEAARAAQERPKPDPVLIEDLPEGRRSFRNPRGGVLRMSYLVGENDPRDIYISEQKVGILKCCNEASKWEPELLGILLLSLEVASSGQVVAASLHDSLNAPSVSVCFLLLAQGWSLPAVDDGRTTYKLLLEFARR